MFAWFMVYTPTVDTCPRPEFYNERKEKENNFSSRCHHPQSNLVLLLIDDVITFGVLLQHLHLHLMRCATVFSLFWVVVGSLPFLSPLYFHVVSLGLWPFRRGSCIFSSPEPVFFFLPLMTFMKEDAWIPHQRRINSSCIFTTAAAFLLLKRYFSYIHIFIFIQPRFRTPRVDDKLASRRLY